MCKYFVEGRQGEYFFGILVEPCPDYCDYFKSAIDYSEALTCICHNCEVFQDAREGNN